MARAMSGADRSVAARIVAQQLVLQQEADRIEARGDRLRLAQRAGEPAASSRAPVPSRCGR
jgi:hypothetical protein